jgi:hypothetical protein
MSTEENISIDYGLRIFNLIEDFNGLFWSGWRWISPEDRKAILTLYRMRYAYLSICERDKLAAEICQVMGANVEVVQAVLKGKPINGATDRIVVALKAYSWITFDESKEMEAARQQSKVNPTD